MFPRRSEVTVEDLLQLLVASLARYSRRRTPKLHALPSFSLTIHRTPPRTGC